MSINSAVYDHLRNHAAISAIVGTRIYQNYAESGTVRPYIILSTISQQTEHHLGGASGVKHARIQIDIYESTSALRSVLAAAIEARLDGWAASRDGAMGDGALDVRSVMLSSESDSYEAPLNATEQGGYRSRADYIISYKP